MPSPATPVPWYRTTAKVATLGLLVLLLLIPAAMVRSLVHERQARHDSVMQEVGRLWGGPQTLLGPVLSVPYERPPRTVRTGAGEPAVVRAPARGVAHFLPATLHWTARIEPERRARGIFEVVVFTVRLHAEGSFNRPTLANLAPEGASPLWHRATLALGITDLRAIRQRPRLEWGGGTLPLLPGTGASTLIGSGVHATVAGLAETRADRPIPFTLELVLGGSESLELLPAGAETTVTASSPWPAPSFLGAFLPRSRRVGADGFTASWEVPALSRGFPQEWTSEAAAGCDLGGAMRRATFGVGLVIPVDGYQQSDRAVKYAILFLGLTFLAFFLLELVSPARLHPVQYLLVGMALCLFYLLLLALSEHLGFTLAYAVAAVATTAAIIGYAVSVLGSRRHAALLGAVLTLLYGFLFVVLRCEDYALLLGAVALFGVLVLIMRLTRRLDWFTLVFTERTHGAGGDAPPPPDPLEGR